MNKRVCSIPISVRHAVVAFACSIGALSAGAQGYIRGAQGFGLAGVNDFMYAIAPDNSGNYYTLGSTGATTFPVTISTGSTSGAILSKFDLDANIIWSRYVVPGTGTTTYYKEILNNNILYLLGTTTATNIATTNGSAFGGGSQDMVLTRVNATNGSILGSTYLGGDGFDGAELDMVLNNGHLYITYATNSSNVVTTTGPAYNGGYDHIIQKVDLTGNILYSTYTGNVAATSGDISLAVENGEAHLGLVVNAANSFVTTDGSTPKGGSDFGLVKLDASGNTVRRSLYGSPENEGKPSILVKNGEVYFAGYSTSSNYPVTDGSSFAGKMRLVLSKFTAAGAVVYSRNMAGYTNNWLDPALSGIDYFDPPKLQYQNNDLYLFGAATGTSGTYPSPTVTPSAVVMNATDGSTGAHALFRLNMANGQTIFATSFGLGGNRPCTAGNLFLTDKGVITTTWSNTQSTVTDGITSAQTGGLYVNQFTTGGKLVYGSIAVVGATLLPTANLYRMVAAYAGDHLILAGNPPLFLTNTFGSTLPVKGSYNNSADLFISNIRFCPPQPTTNTISPLSQTICASGFTQPLTGNKVAYSSANMPVLYRGSTPVQQMSIQARYQWQVASNATGPWTSIGGLGTQKDYTPPVTTISKYYRRLALSTAACGDDTISISSVASVIVGSNTAPAVTGGIYNTCTNHPVNISVNVTGGTPPYTYAWDNGIAGTTGTVSVSPTANSVFTATVTDNNGCTQVGQAIVNAYAADAGPVSASSCAGATVRIGNTPPAGLSGVTYSWTPTAGLNNAIITQPLATPAAATKYFLEMTVPVTGGGTCSTIDSVTVNVVAAPVTAAFAGPDKAVCKGGTTTLGTTGESGFTYTWAPGNYLSTSAGAVVTFNAGNDKASPNPFTYNVTAQKDGCTFTDAVIVYGLEADAGKDYCGPRTVGAPDKDPQIPGKTYLWEVVSGPGTITGATNTPTTRVSASIGGPTTYRVTLSYLGTSCTDEVVVGDNCGGACPGINIKTESAAGCPNYALGNVTLQAMPSSMTGWSYSWSSTPSGGISSTTGSSITLTDNVQRTVTLTATNLDNPALSCSKTIQVNDPSWALPVFTAQDHVVCPGTTVSIGAPAVNGYSYSWTNINPNATVTAANPSVTPAQSTSYYVTVKDDLSGCITKDTASVSVKPLIVDPGSDWTTCSNAVVALGSAARPGYTYSWSPAVASYQGGTSSTSAEPKVLISTTQDFTLTVTDPSTGCTRDSIVHIVVDNSPNLPAMANKTICPGGSVKIGNAPLQNVLYSWSPATGLSSTTEAQPTANPAATQTYTLTVTYLDAGGSPACTKNGTMTVNVVSPQITISDATVCPSAALYNLSTGVTVTGATAYSWSPAPLVTSPNALSTTVRNNPRTPTAFTLTATDANGCRSTATKLITPTTAAPDPGSNGMVCVGTAIQLGSSNNTGTLSWTVSPAIAGTLTTATNPAPLFAPASADSGKTFVFTVSQTIGGCTSTATSSILVRKLSIDPVPVQTICNNASTTIGIAPQTGLSYMWDPVTDLDDPYASSTVVNNVTSIRNYTLTATDASGCFATAVAVVGVNPVPAPTVTIPDVTATIGTSPAAFDPAINPTPGTYLYSWTPANQVDDPYIARATARAGSIGNTAYTLAVTDDNGCTSTAQTQLRVIQAAPLPVTLSSFNVTAGLCSAQLAWTVAAAKDFSHFIIERSSNGQLFSEVKKIGFEAYREHYDHEDRGLADGKWQYRLKMVDLKGDKTYSQVRNVTTHCSKETMTAVFPNPFSNNLNIQSERPVKDVVLLSYTGSVVLAQHPGQMTAAPVQLNLPNDLAPGTYLLKVILQDGNVQYTKVMKQ